MGDFLHDGAAAAARKSCVSDGRPQTSREHKSPPSPGVGGGGGGCLHELWVLELPCEGALLDLDNCLQRSLDTCRQMPLPIKHSVVCSFTPQQLLSNSEKRSKYVSDDSPAPPHRAHPPSALLAAHSFPQGDATRGRRERGWDPQEGSILLSD